MRDDKAVVDREGRNIQKAVQQKDPNASHSYAVESLLCLCVCMCVSVCSGCE